MRLFYIALRAISIYIFPLLVVSNFIVLNIAAIPLFIKYFVTWVLLLFIIINYISWGIWGGIVGLIAAVIVTVYAWMLTGNVVYPVEILPAGLLVSILFFYEERINGNITAKKVEIDEKERNYNLLLQEHKKQESLREAYYKKAKRFSLLSQIAKELGFVLTTEEINRNIILSLTKTIEDGDFYTLWGIRPDLQELELQILENPNNAKAPKTELSDEFNTWVVRHRQPLIVTDVTKDYRFNATNILAKTQIRSLIIAPLITGDRIQGVIRIDSCKPETFSVDDLRLLAIISNMGALTIYNTQLYKQTEYLAIRDDLTELYVKGFFNEKLEQNISEAQIKRTVFSVLLLDLDRFKDLNDQFGHSVGDRVLKKVSELMKDAVSQQNIVARYGGEEFAIILQETEKSGARKIAEEIRKRVEGHTLSIRREGIQTTISIGIAEFPEDGDSLEKLIEKADKCLYEAKRQGRNRIVG